MATKKTIKKASKTVRRTSNTTINVNVGVTPRTWVLFVIFLVVSVYCLKIIFAAQ